MFSTITKFFQKNKKKAEEALDIPEILILEDINPEKEIKEINKQKETKDTKSTLTFGK
tara:strand:+ start:373 stop:546 length:174 start_codon:yes stop_codon:yes gene_type:complete